MRPPTGATWRATLAALALLAAACRPDAPTGARLGTGELLEAVDLPEIDHEPNDRLDQPGDPGAGGVGELDRGDIDVYSLPASSGPRLVRLVSEPAGLATVEVLHASDALGDPPGARTQVVVGREPTLLVVRSTRARDARYQLAITALELPDVGPLAAEPNDASLPLVLQRFPARAAGFYDGPGDRDAVRLETLRPGRAVAVEVSPVPGHRPLLRVLGPNGEALASVAAMRAGEGVGIPNLAPTAEGLPLVIEIADTNEGASLRPWTLSVHRIDLAGEAVNELEPNDTAASPQRLSLTASRFEIRGLFHKADDIDVFALQLRTAGALSMTVTPGAETNLSLNWTRPGGSSQPLDLAGPGAPEQLCAQLAEPGLHLIEVAATGFEGTLARYTLGGSVETGVFEREPNDSLDQTELLEVRDGMRGYLASPGDEDIYRMTLFAPFDADESRRVVVTPPLGVDVAMEVFDDVGIAIAPRIDDAGPGQRETVLVPLRTVSYRLRVSAGRRGGTSCDAPYTIALEEP